MEKAGILLDGNEILSGRTQESNLKFLAKKLSDMGIDVGECRIVSDNQEAIIQAVNALRTTYRYVFTTGGIGPTHDDITADSIAAAFNRPLEVDAVAKQLVAKACAKSGVPLNAARLRMARIPKGSQLIDNPVSYAPGFQIDNVYVMAGVPKIMQAMFTGLADQLEKGPALIAQSLTCNLPEGTMAAPLSEIDSHYPQLNIGSYPSFSATGFSVTLVIRGQDEDMISACFNAIKAMVIELGGEIRDPQPENT